MDLSRNPVYHCAPDPAEQPAGLLVCRDFQVAKWSHFAWNRFTADFRHHPPAPPPRPPPIMLGSYRWWAGRRGRGVARAQKMRKQLLEQAQKPGAPESEP